MRMIDADSLESKLPAHSNDSDHVMTRNFAVESFRALIKAEPTVTPVACLRKGHLIRSGSSVRPAKCVPESAFKFASGADRLPGP